MKSQRATDAAAVLAAVAEVRAGQAEILRAIAAIDARVTTFLTGGARDFSDADVLEALYDVMKQQPFTVGQAMAYAKHQTTPQAVALAAALKAACISSSDGQGLGNLLKRCETRPTGTIVVLRVDDGRKDRVTWQLRPLNVLGLLGSLQSPA